MMKLFYIFSLLFIVSLVSCSSSSGTSEKGSVLSKTEKLPQSVTIFPQAVMQSSGDKKEQSWKLRAPEHITGSGSGTISLTKTRDEVKREKERNITLNFVNVELRDFLRSVFGEMLKLNYVVDPAAQGTITLEATQPVTRDSVLPIVESTLQLHGLAVVEAKGLYQILPSAGAVKKAGFMSNAGLKVKIVPLRYVSVNDMQQTIETIIPPGTILRADPIHNLFITAGDDRDIDNVLEAVSIFDVDSLSGLSFGLFPIKHTTTKVLNAELSSVLNGTTVANMVRLIPLERLNAILVGSRQHHYIDEVESWIGRLDRVGDGDQQSLYVYHVQNGRAADLVAVLNTALVGSPPSLGASKTFSSSGQSDSLRQNGGQVPSSSQGSVQPRHNALDRQDGGGDFGEQVTSSGALRITADEVNNAILLFGTPADYRKIEAALQKLDIMPLQVLIEAAISEVTLTNDLRYGVQYFFTQGQHHVSQIENTSGILAQSFPGFNYVWTSGQKIQTTLNFLETLTDVKMLAAPQLLVLNNQQARIQVGDQVPIATQSATSTLTSTAQVVNSIEYKNTGINLTVTPRVNEGGMVLLDIAQEVSGVTTTTSSTLNSPTIQQRMITSSVAIKDGETIALGGLIQEHQNKTKNGIPLLQEIPYLGFLFGEDNVSGDRTELLILITPHVIRDFKDGRLITEEVRSKLSSMVIDR